MNYQHQDAIWEAHYAIKKIPALYQGLCDAFLMQEGDQAEKKFPGDLIAGQDGISATLLGVTLVAKPRPVFVAGSEFVVEFAFRPLQHPDAKAICLIYLTLSGILKRGLTSDSDNICNYDNRFVRDYLLNELGIALLNSNLYAPEPVGDGGQLGGLDTIIQRMTQTQWGK